MAEFVQQHVEEMLPELMQMERVGLFSGAETRKILKHRRSYEYKLRRRTRHKEDYLQYVQYEMNVLALVKKRREKTGYTFKRMEIDVAIIQRIHRLFKNVCYRFQDDIKLWLSYIGFCKSRNEKASVTKIYTRMLQVHNRNPALWISAAKYEVEHTKSMEKARSLLQRAIRFNTTSQKLWHEYYRMELLNTDKARKRREILGMAEMDVDENEASSAILEGKIALLVYKKSLESFEDVAEFVLGYLPICREFDFTQEHEQEILNDLKTNYAKHEKTWDALAKQHLLTEKKIKRDNNLSQKEKEEEIIKLEEACIVSYEEAVRSTKTECMWELYVKHCLERLQKKASAELNKQRTVNTFHVFQRAYQENLMSQSLYLEWIDFLKKTAQVEQILHALQAAVESYPTSVPLWLQLLTWKQQTAIQGSEEVHSLFWKAVGAVKEKDSLPLWEAMLSWSVINSPQKVESLFEKAILKPASVSESMKKHYLEYVSVNQGIVLTRKLYKRLSASRPHTIDLFLKYIQIEKSQANIKAKKIRTGYEDAIREYGTKVPGLWLDYIDFEMTHQSGEAHNAGQLHWRAIKTLDPELSDTFITQYTLLQTGHL